MQVRRSWKCMSKVGIFYIMNNLSLAQFDKKKWIVRTEKSNNYKIYNDKKRNKSGPTGNGQTLWFYDNGTKLNILHLNYRHNGNGNFWTRSKELYFLRVKDGRLCVYRRTSQGALRNCSNANIANTILPMIFREKKKVYEKRANNVLINFLKRNNIVFEYSKNFSQNMLYACYPGIRGIELNSWSIDSCLSAHFGRGDLKYVVQKCYGYDNKHLVKTIAEKILKDKDLSVLTRGMLLKRFLPVDFYYKLIEKPNSYSTLFCGILKDRQRQNRIKYARAILKSYNSHRAFKLLTCEDCGSYYFTDTFVLYDQYKNSPNFSLPTKPKSWREIHDHILRAFPRQNLFVRGNNPVVYQNEELPIRAPYKNINGLILNEFRFEIPKDTDTLMSYSDKMSNCIRGYGNQVKIGYCDLIGVYKNEKLTYNISISDKTIGQFFGKRNTLPDPQDEKIIKNFLYEQKLIRKPTESVPQFHTNYNAQFVNPAPQLVAREYQEDIVF